MVSGAVAKTKGRRATSEKARDIFETDILKECVVLKSVGFKDSGEDESTKN